MTHSRNRLSGSWVQAFSSLVGLADLAGNVVGRGAPWGHVQSAGGAVHRCLTLEWVVRNIPQKNRHYTHQWTRLSCETNLVLV